ncbi:hypothetical protein E4U43_004810 [Claviceps pusilla]|uniref:Uncharacterized protein n=1 Tax=Claviceps pusilla TaxID=123648 RepID=A0A9P7N2W1_9HYPO|nr:hypothetical protein E4U43_004810 [Claviceps pusilla]
MADAGIMVPGTQAPPSVAHSMPGFAAASTDGGLQSLHVGLASGGASPPQGLPQGLGAPHAPTSDGSTTNTTNHSAHPCGPSALGKRKAETQDNERLSKRLSLLNIERNGAKLYVPVETPSSPASASASASALALPSSPPPTTYAAPPPFFPPADDSMQLDDSKHKVYIYNLDDELTPDNSEDEDSNGKLVFLPDIDKHLRENRIPPHVLANSDGQLAGMQLVLYSDPRSLSVPEEKDGVRKAILEARQRTREKQRLERESGASSSMLPGGPTHDDDKDDDEMDLD